MPLISVAVCTYNRFEYLPDVLDGLAAQTLHPDKFEVLVIDNSSDHAAADAFRAAYTLLSNVRWLESSPPGLSRARNFALREARSPIVAFLDDDAIPVSAWVEELLATFQTFPEAAVVAGPIEPRWGAPRPSWMPTKYEAALGILDLGTEDRALGDREGGFGANLSVRRDAALAVGAFDEAIGRIGSGSLLSHEEMVLQDRLRAAGYGARYAARARVFHHMQAERLTRNWFRSRMAWQVVSVSLQEGNWPHSDWSRQELLRAASALGIDEALGVLLAARNGDAFADQIDVLQNLVGVLLAANREPDITLEGLFLPATEGAPSLVPGLESKSELLSDAYRPSAALPVTTQIVFAEYSNSHGYLFDLYGDLPDSAFVELPGSAWDGDSAEAIDYLQASLPPQTRAVFLLTLDSWIFVPGKAESLIAAIERWQIPTLGIQHRLPETVEHRQALAAVAHHLYKVVALSESMASQLSGLCNLTNVTSIPLHPSKFRYMVPGQVERARAAIGAANNHTVFAVVGDVRAGKGIDLLLSALDYLSVTVRESLFILLAGRAGEFDPEAITEHLAARRIAGRVDLRRHTDPHNYALLTSVEYADLIAAADFGLLLYQGSQRSVVSGALYDFLWQGKRVLATRDSLLGAEVAKHGLGLTLDVETPEALAKLMTDAVVLREEKASLGPNFAARRQACSPQATLDALQAVIDSISVRDL
jgi:glucosyl-dolichyl phosphate glucuronosyltransferase